MNYFELYDIPLSFQPDLGLVKQQFYALSRQYHPDYLGDADDLERQEALQVSADINKAYKVFQNQDALIKYILQLYNLLEEEEKYNLPPDFLMEVMELNEQAMDLQHHDATGLESILANLTELENSIYEPIKTIFTNDDAVAYSEKTLLQVKLYYFKKKYLNKIRAQLKP